MNNEMKKEDLFWWLLIIFLVENQNLEWKELRDLSSRKNPRKKLTSYFNKIFQDGIQSSILNSGTHFYRARHIKRNDWSKLGANLLEIENKVYSMLLSEDEMEIMDDWEIKFTPKQLFCMKFSQINTLTKENEEQLLLAQKKLNEYVKVRFQGFLKEECGVAPKKYRKGQRFSTKKDPYLYLALEAQTAINEMRPFINQTYSLAECVSNKELKLADFCKFEIFDNGEIPSYKYLLPSILETNADNANGFYNITQYLSRYIKHKGFDGIIYKSSLTANGSNIMLFDESTVDFISSKIIGISDVVVQYKDLVNNNS